MIEKEYLVKFKNLYLEKFNISLNDEETTKMASDLMNLMKILLQPDTTQITNDSTQEERSGDETFTTVSK